MRKKINLEMRPPKSSLLSTLFSINDQLKIPPTFLIPPNHRNNDIGHRPTRLPTLFFRRPAPNTGLVALFKNQIKILIVCDADSSRSKRSEISQQIPDRIPRPSIFNRDLIVRRNSPLNLFSSGSWTNFSRRKLDPITSVQPMKPNPRKTAIAIALHLAHIEIKPSPRAEHRPDIFLMVNEHKCILRNTDADRLRKFFTRQRTQKTPETSALDMMLAIKHIRMKSRPKIIGHPTLRSRHINRRRTSQKSIRTRAAIDHRIAHDRRTCTRTTDHTPAQINLPNRSHRRCWFTFFRKKRARRATLLPASEEKTAALPDQIDNFRIGSRIVALLQRNRHHTIRPIFLRQILNLPRAPFQRIGARSRNDPNRTIVQPLLKHPLPHLLICRPHSSAGNQQSAGILKSLISVKKGRDRDRSRCEKKKKHSEQHAPPITRR